MLGGFAESFARAPVKICKHSSAGSGSWSWPEGGGGASRWTPSGQGICLSAPVSSDFYVLPCAALGRARSWSWTAAATILLDEVYAFLRAARWRALSRSWTAAATTLLDEVYYPTTDPAADFGLGPKAEAEGRVPIPGICCSASLTADFGSGWEAARRGTAGLGFF